MSFLAPFISRIKKIDAALLAGLITFALFSLPLLQGLRFIGVDATLQDIPYICEMKRLFIARQAFWLSPRLGNGLPLFADLQSQTLYPIRWLFFLLAPVFQKSMEVLIHLSIAAFAMSLLLKKYGVRRGLSILGGISFVLSGTVLDLVDHGPYLIAAAWLPLGWAMSREIVGNPKWRRRDFIFLLVCFLFLLLGGEPQSFAILFVIVMLECFLSAKNRAGSLLVFFGAAILAVGISAPLLLAASGELSLSTRFTEIYSDTILQWSMDFPSALATIWPGVLHEATQQGINFWQTWSSEAVGSTAMPWNWNPYLGLPIIACALSIIFQRRLRVPALVLLIALVFSLGSNLIGMNQLVRLLPILGSFRYPMKYFFSLSVAVWILAFCALEEVYAGLKKNRAILYTFIALLVSQLLALFWVHWQADLIDAQAFLLRKQQFSNLDLPLMSWMLSLAITHAIGIALLCLGCLYLRVYRGYRVEKCVPWLILLDLGLAAYGGISLDYNFLSRPSALSLSLHAVPGAAPVLCHNYDVANMNVQFKRLTSAGLTTVDSSDLMWKYVDIPNLNACDDISAGVQYSMLEQPPNYFYKQKIREGSLAASIALGCTHLVTAKLPSVTGELNIKSIFVPGLSDPRPETANVSPKLLEISNPVTPIFLVKSPHLHETSQASIDAVLQARTTEEITNQLEDPLRHWKGLESLSAISPNVKIIGFYWPERTHAEVDLEGSGTAVVGLKTVFALGWHASQAGQKLPMVRIAGSLLGAVVGDASKGPIIFQYRAPHLWWGVSISLLSLFALGIWLSRKRA